VTNRIETISESLITVSLPEKLHHEAIAFQERAGLSNLSEVIRHALENFPENGLNVEPIHSRQVSFPSPIGAPHSYHPSSSSSSGQCRAHRQGSASIASL
jgi:hypothetical protein